MKRYTIGINNNFSERNVHISANQILESCYELARISTPKIHMIEKKSVNVIKHEAFLIIVVL